MLLFQRHTVRWITKLRRNLQPNIEQRAQRRFDLVVNVRLLREFPEIVLHHFPVKSFMNGAMMAGQRGPEAKNKENEESRGAAVGITWFRYSTKVHRYWLFSYNYSY